METVLGEAEQHDFRRQQHIADTKQALGFGQEETANRLTIDTSMMVDE